MRLDLTREESTEEIPHPVLTLRLSQCQGANDACRTLANSTGYALEISFLEEDGRRSIELIPDYREDDLLTVEYGKSSSEREEYTLTDLQLKLRTLNAIFRQYSRDREKTEKHLRGTLEAVKSELIKGLDRATRKKDFFADKDKAAQFEAEQRCYQKLLDLLGFHEKQKQD